MTANDRRGAEQTLQEALGDLERIARDFTDSPLALRRIDLLTNMLEADISYLINPQQLIQTQRSV